MIKKPMVIIAFLILCSDASAQSKKSFAEFVKEPAFTVKGVGTAMDFGASFKADGVHFVEANPLFARRNGSFAWERNLAYTAGSTWFQFELYRRGHRKAAVVLMFADGILRGFLGARAMRMR